MLDLRFYALKLIFGSGRFHAAATPHPFRNGFCAGVVLLATALTLAAQAETCGLQNAIDDGTFVDGFNSPSSTCLGQGVQVSVS